MVPWSPRAADSMAVALLAIGVIALLGWSCGLASLREVFGAAAMNPATALAFVAAAVAMALAARPGPGPRRARVALGLCIALVGALRIAAPSGLLDAPPVDTVLFAATLAGNRMASNAAIAFVLLGFALAALDVSLGRHRPATWLLAAAGTVSWLVAVGYTFNALSFYRASTRIPMALPTALGFLLACVGLILARPDREPLATFIRRSAGGAMARRLVPVALIAPVLVGWLHLEAQRRGLLSTETAVGTVVVATSATFLFGVWWSSRALNAIDLARASAEERLRELAIADDLTGLRNRRGFLELARHQLLVSERQGQPNLLLFMDLDGLKRINDVQGHHAGDRALADFADVLRRAFRTSDIVARLGGDEFVALLVDTRADGPLASRLAADLIRHNAEAGRPYELAVSVGISAWDASMPPRSIEARLTEADAAMYHRKSARSHPDLQPAPPSPAANDSLAEVPAWRHAPAEEVAA